MIRVTKALEQAHYDALMACALLAEKVNALYMCHPDDSQERLLELRCEIDELHASINQLMREKQQERP